LPFEILLPSPEPKKPDPNPGVVPEELMLMFVGLGGDVPSAAAAAMLVPPGGEKGLNSDWEPRLPLLGPTATDEGLGWFVGTEMGATMVCGVISVDGVAVLLVIFP
jgi:hypothetical protein